MARRDWSHAEVGTCARVIHPDGVAEVVMADGSVRQCDYSSARRRYPYPLTKVLVLPAGDGAWWCAGSIEAAPMVLHQDDFCRVPAISASAGGEFHTGRATWDYQTPGAGLGFTRQAVSAPVGYAGALEVQSQRITTVDVTRPEEATGPECWWIFVDEAMYCRWRVNIVALPNDSGAYIVAAIFGFGEGAEGSWAAQGTHTNWEFANTSLTTIDATGHPLTTGEWVDLEIVCQETVFACGWIDGDGPFYVTLDQATPDYSAGFGMLHAGGQFTNPATTQAMWDLAHCTRLCRIADEQTVRSIAVNTPEGGAERIVA